MNTENIRRIRDIIAAEPERCQMSQFAPNQDPTRLKSSCSTGGCIAGWAAAEAGFNPGFDTTNMSWAETIAVQRLIVIAGARYLGFDTRLITFADGTSVPSNKDDIAELFFIKSQGDVAVEHATAEDTLAVLDHLLATGEVEWPIIEWVGEE